MSHDENKLILSEKLINTSEIQVINEKISSPEKNNYFYEKIENWKSFYFKLTTGSISGSIFCLLCLTFGSGKKIQTQIKFRHFSSSLFIREIRCRSRIYFICNIFFLLDMDFIFT